MNYLLLVLRFLPLILEAVSAVERIAGGLKGSDKKDIILNSLPTEGQSTSNLKLIGELVDKVVKALNESGVFTKSAPATSHKAK